MSLLVASSITLFATLMLVLLAKKDRPPLQQAILGASIAAMVLVVVDQTIGTLDGVFVPLMLAFIIGILGTILYEYIFRRGRTV